VAKDVTLVLTLVTFIHWLTGHKWSMGAFRFLRVPYLLTFTTASALSKYVRNCDNNWFIFKMFAFWCYHLHICLNWMLLQYLNSQVTSLFTHFKAFLALITTAWSVVVCHLLCLACRCFELCGFPQTVFLPLLIRLRRLQVIVNCTKVFLWSMHVPTLFLCRMSVNIPCMCLLSVVMRSGCCK